MDTYEDLLVSLEAPSNKKCNDCHYEWMCFPIYLIDVPSGISADDNFGRAGNRWAIFSADVANNTRIGAHPLNLE